MYESTELPDVSDLGLQHPGEIAYAQQMAARENALHGIFGPTVPPDQIFSPDDPNLTVNWAGGGIYQYPPRGRRASWHYVTSGLSQPEIDDDNHAQPTLDEDGQSYSGFGIELVISTSEMVAWAPEVLVNLVKYLLFQKNSRVILPGDRLPCNGPLVLNTSTPLCFLIAASSTEYETNIQLPAGKCELVHLVGSTEQEINAALEMGQGTAGSFVLSRVMCHMGVGFDSLPDRECLTTRNEFREIWEREKSNCEAEWERGSLD